MKKDKARKKVNAEYRKEFIMGGMISNVLRAAGLGGAILAAGFSAKAIRHEHLVYGPRVDLKIMQKYGNGTQLLTERKCTDLIKGEFDKDGNGILSHDEQLEVARYAFRPFQFSCDVNYNVLESFRNFRQAFNHFPREGAKSLDEVNEELRDQYHRLS